MIIKTVLALSTLALSSLAMAADIPRFEVEAICKEITGGSRDMFNFCIEQEQKSYNQLRDKAESIDPRTVSYCTEGVGDSYEVLLFCIEDESDDENEPANSLKSFSFD
ncbi:hypothetical protein B0H98_10882 [Vreelandella songnenensis]|uniref:Uncharacterized protein n=1 Tax=Vreelandella songnenensis TaxID=1176243 RepID=A0A2T0V050_9GAMM|nr:hypothetical protein [Halomonas songnenensis]PRY63487.1 hypothetical protein B0H98_10882 [Halomonas songnenensis]